MPVPFNPAKRLSKKQYFERRDITTEEEVAKLMASAEYKQFCGQKAGMPLGRGLGAVALLLISLAFIAGKMTSSSITCFQVRGAMAPSGVKFPIFKGRGRERSMLFTCRELPNRLKPS